MNPLAGVIEASDGLLYGTTEKGGAHGKGTLYRLAKDGTAFQTLYHFPATGGSPVAGLIEAADGRLYGVAPTGGDGANPGGFLFSINRDGSGVQTLHSFSQVDPAGVAPTGGLVQAGDGGIYGTTRSGPACPVSHCGGIFRYQPGGAFTAIHSFADPTLGASPEARLTLDTGGNLYGSTSAGGVNGHGTAFVLALPRLDLTGPAQADAGGTATYSLAVTNISGIPLAAPQTPALEVSPALGLSSETADAWTCNIASPGRFDCAWGADLAPGASTGTHAWTFDVGGGPYAPGCGTGPGPCLAVTATDPTTGQTARVLTPVALKRPDGTSNGFPQAVDDAATLYLPGSSSVTLDIVVNDSDPEGDPLTIGGIVTPPAAGTVVINGDGTVTYSPADVGAGTDQFRYRVADGLGASATALVTVTSKEVGVNLSKSRLDIGNVPTGRLAAGRFWVDATPAPYEVDIRFANLNPAEIDAALTGTGYDRAQTQSDAAAFAANGCLTAPGETSCPMAVYFRPAAPAGKVSIARADLTLIDRETLRPMATRSIIVVGRSALESEAPVVARDDTFTVGAGTAILVSPLANDGTAGAPLYFAGVGVCNFAPPDLAYAPCATNAGTTHTPVVGTSQVRITPEPGFNGTNAFLYGVSQEECVDQPGCRYENTICYAVVTVNVVPGNDVALTLAADPATVNVDQPVTITATVKNNGSNPATNVGLSGFAAFTGFNPGVTPSVGRCDPAPAAGSPLQCALGTLAAGASATIVLVVAPNSGAFPPGSTATTIGVSGTATVLASEPDPMLGNNTASAGFTVSRPGTAQLTITRTGVGSGTVTSASGIDCGNVCSLTGQLGGVVVLEATPAADSRFAGWSGACGGTANCSVVLDREKSVTATFVRPYAPRLSASFQPVTSWETRNGANFAFLIAIRNGAGSTTGATTGPITVTDLLPEGLTFVPGDSSAECTAAGQLVTCVGGTGLAAGFTKYFRIGTTVAVDSARLPAQLINRVTALSTPDDSPALPAEVTITVEASSGTTPVGKNVAVRPTDAAGVLQPIVVSFAEISAAGSTTATPLLAGFQPPAGFAIDGLVYDIATTAAYTAPVTVCFDGAFTASSVIQHGETDATGGLTAWNILPNQRLLPAGPGPYTRICADSNTLSPFAVMQRLANEPTPTVTLGASRGPSTYGQPLRLTAKVKGMSPVGAMTFLDGETPLGYIMLRRGKAVLRISDLHAGIHEITANYSGDVHYNTSRSATLRQVIRPSATRTRLRTSNPGARAGQAITLMASIKGESPTGTVHFMDGPHLLGTGEVSHNQATLSGAGLVPGTHRITASYSGDLNHKPSISPVLKQRIH